tara:strand:- start:272 stop:448 length:177 start_codon:yes stop_codon:yes gene_type:complete
LIPRYSRKILKDIWEDQNKFQIWLDLEILACEAMEKLGHIPIGTTKKLKKKLNLKLKK